jgi:hypothetical protein
METKGVPSGLHVPSAATRCALSNSRNALVRRGSCAINDPGEVEIVSVLDLSPGIFARGKSLYQLPDRLADFATAHGFWPEQFTDIGFVNQYR